MERFIKIYDKTTAFELKAKKLEEQYVELGIEEKHAFTRRKVDAEIMRRVLHTLKPVTNDYLSRSELEQVKRALIYKSVLEHTEQYEDYIVALEELSNIGGNNIDRYVPLTDEQKWMDAMGYLKGYLKRNPPQTEFAKGFRKKEIDRAKAAERLKKLGAHVLVKDNDLSFDRLYTVTSEISSLISQIGGVRFVEEILKPFPFNVDTGRLEPIKQGNQFNPDAVGPDYPFGYLLNLGFRHTSSKGSQEKLEKNLERIVKLAEDLCTAVYPVMNHHILEDIFHRGESPIDYFRRLTILDSIYYIQQNNAALAVDINGFLIERLLSMGYELSDVGITMMEYKGLMNELSLLAQEKTFVHINSDSIKTVAEPKRKKALLKLICIEVGKVNPLFEKPLDYDKVNYSDAPLILLPNGEALLYPSTLGVAGWYEKLMALLREKYNDPESKFSIDGIVGPILEEYVIKQFAAKGIATKHGKYQTGKINGECDIVVETTNRVLLMELKKKNMTRAARQGQKYQIVLDFAGSLFNSQEQCFRTKLVLMRDSQVSLTDGANSCVLEYKGRPTENITLTLNDYGCLQDRFLLKQVLEQFMKYRFTVDDAEVDATDLEDGVKESVKKGYKALYKKQDNLDDYLNEIYTIEKAGIPEGKKFNFDPFFDSWFLNIEQLCYLLKISKDLDEFEQNLNCLKYTEYGTKDFWAELPLKLGMKNQNNVIE